MIELVLSKNASIPSHPFPWNGIAGIALSSVAAGPTAVIERTEWFRVLAFLSFAICIDQACACLTLTLWQPFLSEPHSQVLLGTTGLGTLVFKTFSKVCELQVIAYGISINLVEVTWKSKIKQQFPNPNDYSSFMGDFSTATGAVTFTMMILSRWIFKKFGWGVAALITPTVLLVTGMPWTFESNLPFTAAAAPNLLMHLVHQF